MSDAKHIVFATTGSLGDLHPFMAVGLKLQQAGHRITIATTKLHEVVVEQSGLTFAHMRPDSEQTPEFHKQFMHPTKSGPFVFKNYLGPAIRQSYDDLKEICAGADLLVSQSLALAAPLVATTTNIPWISAVFQPMTLFSAYDPPRLPGLPFVMQPKTVTTQNWNTKLLGYAKTYTADWVAPVIAFKKELGLNDTRHPIYDGQYAPRLNLAMFSPLFGTPQADWPDNTLQTGTVILPQAEPSVADSGKLAQFLNAGAAPLVFTLGASSANDAGDFYQASLDAARRLKMRAILLTGGLAASQSFANNDDVLQFSYMPYHAVFPHAAAIVHAGGIGAGMLALQAGKPQILVPSAHDQRDNALRLARLGVGLVIPKLEYTANRVAKALADVLKNHMLVAAQLATLARAENGLDKTCAAITEFLNHG